MHIRVPHEVYCIRKRRDAKRTVRIDRITVRHLKHGEQRLRHIRIDFVREHPRPCRNLGKTALSPQKCRVVRP